MGLFGKKKAAPPSVPASPAKPPSNRKEGGGAWAAAAGRKSFLGLASSRHGSTSSRAQPEPAVEPAAPRVFERDLHPRHGYYINPNPSVKLEAPASYEPTEEEEAERRVGDQEATALVPQNVERYKKLVKKVNLFSEMGLAEIEAAASQLLVRTFQRGEIIYDEGDAADADGLKLDKDGKPTKDRGGGCWVLEDGEVVASVLIPGVAEAGTWEWKETREYSAKSRVATFFGERGLLRNEPRPLRMTCKTAVKALRITSDTFVACARISERKEGLIRGVALLEQCTDAQVAKIAAAITRREFREGEEVTKQGEVDSVAYLVEKGELLATVGGEEKRRYMEGSFFCDEALYADAPAEATVTAVGDACVYALSRADFEARLGDHRKLNTILYQIRMYHHAYMKCRRGSATSAS